TRALMLVPLNCSWMSPVGTFLSAKPPAVSTWALIFVPATDTVRAADELLTVPLMVAVPPVGTGTEDEGPPGVVERSEPHATSDSATMQIVTIANRLNRAATALSFSRQRLVVCHDPCHENVKARQEYNQPLSQRDNARHTNRVNSENAFPPRRSYAAVIAVTDGGIVSASRFSASGCTMRGAMAEESNGTRLHAGARAQPV